MDRRDFMIHTAVAGAIWCAPSLLCASKAPPLSLYTIDWRFDLSHHNAKTCALWVPLPGDIDGFQHVIELGWNGDADQSFMTEKNAYDARTLYALWDKNSASRILNVQLTIALRDRQCTFKPMRLSAKTIRQSRRFLAPTPHIPTDGAVAKAAGVIVSGEKNPLRKARKIYDWIIDNSYRDESVRGCGTGSVNSMLAQLERDGRMGGKCLDMSALCVALMRASGIPAREVMGIRVGPSRFSEAFGAKEEITKSQHCKVEFFIDTLGWVPCDPADITKLILKEGLEPHSPRVRALAERFFGFWENNWMALNHARDFDLYPANAQGSLDSFGYVYGESDGEYLDPFDPSAYRYAIRSRKGAR